MNRNLLSSILISLVILMGVVAVTASTYHLWDPSGFVLIGGAKQLAIPGFILLFSGLALNKFKFTGIKIIPEVFILGLLWIFSTDWLFNPYGLTPAPSSRGGLILFILISAILTFCNKTWNYRLLALGLLSIVLINFLGESAGNLITTDDHATFLHRLILLKQNFPNVPVYDALWNSGYDQRAFFATGSFNYFFLTLPLTYFFEPQTVYNFCFIIAAILLPFASTYLACRVLNFPRRATWIACILILAPSAEWYQWIYNSGTMGFVISAGLMPLNIALVIKLLNTEEKFPFYYALLLIITFTLMLFWSASGLMFIPLIIVGIYKIIRQKLFFKNYVRLILLALLLINVPWIIALCSVSKVGNFIQSEKTVELPKLTTANNQVNLIPADHQLVSTQKFKHKSSGIEIKNVMQLIRDMSSKLNPLLLFLAIPGVFLFTKHSRKLLLFTFSWMALCLTCYQLKPQLELDRVFILYTLISCLPAALAIDQILARYKVNQLSYRSLILNLIQAITLGFLIATCIQANVIINNQTLVKHSFQGETTAGLINEISQYKNRGRVLFSGMILHEINGGHLAPISEYTQTPIIAKSFTHDTWNYQQVFPVEILQDHARLIPEYLDLNNVVAVFAHEPFWIKFFQEHSDLFSLKTKVGHFYLFDYHSKNKPSYFLNGNGVILEQNNHNLKFMLDNPEAIIKFRYFPFLETNSTCQMKAKKMFDELELIELTGCPVNQEIILKAKPLWKRILGR